MTLRGWLLVLVSLVALSGCRWIAEYDHATGGGGPAPALVGGPDLGPDGGGPDPGTDDGALSRRLSFQPPEAIGGNGPTMMLEPTVAPDGLSVWIRGGANRSSLYGSTRPTVNDPFDPWTLQSARVPADPNYQAPAFFEHQGERRIMVAVEPKPRRLLFARWYGLHRDPGLRSEQRRIAQ